MPTPIRIPIDLTGPHVSTLSGNAVPGAVALTNYDWYGWIFLANVDGIITARVTVPKNVAAAPNAKIILIVMGNAVTGVSRLQVQQKAVADDNESANVTFTSETAQDVTMPTTAYFHKRVTFNLTGSDYVADDIIELRIRHEGNHVNDTYAVDTLLDEAYLEIDVN